jgi:predicted transposase/invertase (TIGR01784 family)
MNVNKKHKNSVFSALFSNPEVLRELYSAISGVTIGPNIPVGINTLTDVLYRDRINDLSFTIDNRLVVLIEHQSTVNDNIPLRLLEYIGRIYEKIIDRKKTYHAQLVKIYKPEFIVLYNGTDPYPDYKELRLSDAFMDIEVLKPEKKCKIPLELVVQVYNINHGHNCEILERSTTLDSYSVFIDKVREHRKAGSTLEESTKNAIKYCIDHNILKGFFETNSSEVFNMLTDEWNWEEYKEVALEEAREEGWELGNKEGIEQTARNLLAIGITTDDIVRATGLPLEKVRVLASVGS